MSNICITSLVSELGLCRINTNMVQQHLFKKDIPCCLVYSVIIRRDVYFHHVFADLLCSTMVQSLHFCVRPSLLTLLPRPRGPESLLLKRCRFMRKQRRGPVCFDERDLWERLAHMLLVTPSLYFSLSFSLSLHTPPHFTTTLPQSFACSLFFLL